MAATTLSGSEQSDLALLASQHGLSVAGARPKLAKYVRQVWQYRHFTTSFATAGVVASLNHHRLGRLWQVLTPLTNAAVYYLIFGIILRSNRGVHDFISYLCIGVFFYTFTSQCVSQGVVTITKNIGLVRVLQFPRATLPLSTTFSQLQNLLYSLVVLVCIIVARGELPRWSWLLVLPVLGLQTVFNIGLSMITARMGNSVTDLKQIIPFVMRVWMYCSGVMYAATNFADHLPKPIAKVALVNPLVVYLEMYRQVLLSHEKKIMTMPWTHLWFWAVFWAVVVGVGGFIYFWRGEQEYGRG